MFVGSQVPSKPLSVGCFLLRLTDRLWCQEIHYSDFLAAMMACELDHHEESLAVRKSVFCFFNGFPKRRGSRYPSFDSNFELIFWMIPSTLWSGVCYPNRFKTAVNPKPILFFIIFQRKIKARGLAKPKLERTPAGHRALRLPTLRPRR